jgi:hypothetical protein
MRRPTGYGPIDPDLARQLAGTAAGWDRLFTSPTTGAVLAIDRYRPSRDQLRMLRARDEHCRFPDAASRSPAATSTTPSHANTTARPR